MFFKTMGLAIALLSTVSAAAQWSVKGRVLDENHDALPGATITLVNSPIAEVSDTGGYFTLDGLKRPKYNAEIRYVGFRTKNQTIRKDNAHQILIVTMEPFPVYAGEVQVTATRAGEKTPVAFTTLDKQEIEEENSGRDVPYLLQNTPGTVSYSDAGTGIGYTGLRIRGSDITRINVTINGIPLNDAESQGVFWVNTPDFVSSTQSMQVQRGVGTSTNGAGAFGASINLETDGPTEKPYGALHASGGSFNTKRITAEAGTGLIKDHWWFESRGSKITSDGYVDRATSDLNSYFLTGGYVSDITSIRAVVFGGGETTYQAWNGVDSATYANDPTFNSAGAIYNDDGDIVRYYDDETDNYKQDHYQLHWNQRLTDRLKFNLSFHYTYGRGYYEQYRQNADFAYYGLKPLKTENDTVNTTDLIRRLWLDNDFYGTVANFEYNTKDWRLVLGGAFHHYQGLDFGEITWARYASNSEKDERFYESAATKLDGNAYAKAYYNITGQLTAFADMQVRSINYRANGIDEGFRPVDFEYDRVFFNPKAGLTYQCSEGETVYASYAVAHKEPNRNDILAADPGDLPQPERLQDVEAGYQYSSEKFSASANAYYMYYTDQLVLNGEINEVGAFVRENVGKSYRAGLELSGKYKPVEEFSVAPSISWSRNINLNYKAGEGADIENLGNTEIAFSPAWVINAEMKYRPLKGLSFEWTPRYVSEQYLSNTNQPNNVLSAYFLNDLKVSYEIPVRLVKTLSVYAQALNVLDEQYAANGYTYNGQPYFFPQAGRHFMGGLRARF